MGGFATSELEPLKKALAAENIAFRTAVALKDYTTFRIGGPAALFVPVTDERQLCAALRLINAHNAPRFVLGRGSNTLFADEGYAGAIIYICGGLGALATDGAGNITAGAGVNLAALCRFAADNALTGLEFAYGIPGSVGGAAVMNAGAYGGEMSQVMSAVAFADENGETGTLTADRLDCGYRRSAFSDGSRVVTSVSFSLKPGDKGQIEGEMKQLLARRAEKQPLDLPSAGSTFLRPEGHYAGALIEQAGLKGVKIGGAAVSEKHAGFVVNAGGASATDVLALIDLIKKRVFECSGVTLQCEIKIPTA